LLTLLRTHVGHALGLSWLISKHLERVGRPQIPFPNGTME
jgi:hypothetical protein